VRPHYAKAGNGRQPVGLSIMLRMYFVQQWFNLSDPGVEEVLYESATLRWFVGVDLGVAPAPDETTICRFRHLLEKAPTSSASVHPRVVLAEGTSEPFSGPGSAGEAISRSLRHDAALYHHKTLQSKHPNPPRVRMLGFGLNWGFLKR
jgi:hypothetical protein